MQTALLIAQSLTFVLLGAVFFLSGDWKLGLAQVLLAAVNMLVYT